MTSPRVTKSQVRIGVTGHRFLADMDRVVAGVDKALHRVEQAFPGRKLTVISPLAEGADRLVAERVLARPLARLIAVLPLPQSDYMQDFRTAESRTAFLRLLNQAERVLELPPRQTREEAYEAVGHYVLNHCQLLIAIWDGREAQGQGGTAEIVAEARRRGLPLAWIHAGNRKPGTEEPTTLREEQGKVTLERFPGRCAEEGQESA